jgi:hypothetical protein
MICYANLKVPPFLNGSGGKNPLTPIISLTPGPNAGAPVGIGVLILD